MPGKSKTNELRITRLYDAPVEAVWDAWVDPAQVAQWWGPRGFTITTHSKDLRPGGTWDYTMHGPDGTDYPNTTLYFEVEEHKRLVYDHGGHRDRPPLFRVTVEFSEVKGKTRMEMSMKFATVEVAEQSRKFIKSAGGEATWDRLGEYLLKQADGHERFIINRSFDAPIGVIYDMWTDPRHLARWLPPTGLEMEFLRGEPKAGTTAFYVMRGADLTLHGLLQYVELRRPELIVYAQQFCDERENVSRHPMAPVWPETMLTTVTFTEEGADRTRVTVSSEPKTAVPAELDAFIAERAGMTRGWTASFDKLEALLEAADGAAAAKSA